MPFWVLPLLGGVLIGLASLGLVWGTGRVAGISGVMGGALTPSDSSERGWRVSFLGGLLVGGFILAWLYPAAFPKTFASSLWVYGVMGAVVGFGTRLGNGCTSGHGVCGVSRMSQRSIVATLTFIAAGMVTVYITRHVLGGVS